MGKNSSGPKMEGPIQTRMLFPKAGGKSEGGQDKPFPGLARIGRVQISSGKKRKPGVL